MGNSSYNNTETGMVSGDSSMEPTSAWIYQGAYSAFNFICINIDSYHHPKHFSRIAFFSQTIVFQFVKEV